MPLPAESWTSTGRSLLDGNFAGWIASSVGGVPVNGPGGWSLRRPTSIQSKRTETVAAAPSQELDEGSAATVSCVCGTGSG